VHDSSNFHTTNIESWKSNPFSGTPLTGGSGTKMPDRRDDIPSRQVGNECHSVSLMLPRHVKLGTADQKWICT
jgi:hypothetical protein